MARRCRESMKAMFDAEARRRWGPLFAASLAGAAVWIIAAANGHALAMIWLPAVLAGATWP